jgi:hypothetical protein
MLGIGGANIGVGDEAASCELKASAAPPGTLIHGEKVNNNT